MPRVPFVFFSFMFGHGCVVRRSEARAINTPRQPEPIDGPYAVDALIIGANTRFINVFLHAIEGRSSYIFMKFDLWKWANLISNQQQSSVRFAPNGPAQSAEVSRKNTASFIPRYFAVRHF